MDEDRATRAWREFETHAEACIRWLEMLKTTTLYKRQDARDAIGDAIGGLRWVITPPVTVEIVHERAPYARALPAPAPTAPKEVDEDE